MQHLGAAAGDLLRLIVVQRAQQPRLRRRARIGAEHARHVGPDLQRARLQLGREVGGRGIRAAAAEQHGVARGIAGDEALRQNDTGQRRRAAPAAPRRRENRRSPTDNSTRALASARSLGLQPSARIPPVRRDALRIQVARTELGGHQLAGGHHARARAIADLAHERDAARDLPQHQKVALQLGARVRCRARARAAGGAARSPAAAARALPASAAASSFSSRSVMPLSAECTTSTRGRARQPRAHHRGDVAPVGGARHARAAELEHDPGRHAET